MHIIPTSLVLSIFFVVTAVAEEEITFKRLKSAPDAIAEVFFKIDKSGRVKIAGEVIHSMRVQVEEGKGHGQLYVRYENNSSEAVAPEYIVQLYNPYGMLVSGVRVAFENEEVEELIEPGENSSKSLGLRVTRLESIFRHTEINNFPSDFFSVRWLSISDANTKIGKLGGGELAPTPESISLDEDSTNPESKSERR